MQHLCCQIQFDLGNGTGYLVRIGTKNSGGVDIVGIKLIYHIERNHIQGGDSVYLVAEKFNAQDIIGIRKSYVHRISFDTETTTGEFHIIAHILRFHQGVQEICEFYGLILIYRYTGLAEVLWVTNTV